MNTHAMPRLPILELGRVREGGDRRTALDEARELARKAEDWGYQRFWIAEHHNLPAVTTAATSIVIAHVAAGTCRIRVGAGGVMLPSLPFGFASHFAPQALDQALSIYRQRFKPSAQLDRPYVLVGVNIVAAPTDAEARHLATSQQMSFTDIFRGTRGLTQPPIDDIEAYWTPQEKVQASSMLAHSIIGAPDTVRAGMQALTERTEADELMVISDLFNFDLRLRSFRMTAEIAGVQPGPPSLS